MVGKRTWITEHSDTASAPQTYWGDKKKALQNGIWHHCQSQSSGFYSHLLTFSPQSHWAWQSRTQVLLTGTFFGALQLCPQPGWAVSVCGAAVPSAVPSAVLSAASAVAPGCPERGTQINVLPVSLREAWRQNKGYPAQKNTWKIQYTENLLKSFSVFRVEESRGFSFPVVMLLFQKLALEVVE